MKKTFIYFLLFSFHFSFAQQHKIDSLLSLIKTDKEDTNKVIHLNKISIEYRNLGSYDSSIAFTNTALKLSYQLNPPYKKGIATAYNNIGTVYKEQSDYPNALDCYLKALKMDEELEDESGKAKRLGNIGVVYSIQGNYSKALEYYFKALKIAEEVGDKKTIATRLINIGVVYWNQNDYVKTLDYYFKALKIDEELGDKKGIAITLSNIGITYSKQYDYPKALEYSFKALKIDEELRNKNGIARHLHNIGGIYYEQGKREKSGVKREELTNKVLEYYFKALKIAEELGDKGRIASILGNIGTLYISQKKYSKAYRYIYRALALSESIGEMNGVQTHYNYLSELYEKSNVPLPDSIGNKFLNMEQMRLRSMYYYKRSIAIRDTLFSQENKKELVRKEMNFEFDKKEALTKAEQDKKDAITAEEKQKQKIITYSIGGGLFLVLLFALFIFRGYKQKQKANKLLAEKNILIEQQKKHIEEKHKETTDSITYAKRLQQAILPPTELIKKHFKNSFVLYKPKDIVAGDFYWMEVITPSPNGEGAGGEVVFIAAADSTGHGVPGAMVSVVCSNALNRTVKEFGLRETGKILDKVTDLVLETFEKSGEQIKDGMDISLLAYNKTSRQIQWSGANNPLWYIQNGQVVEIKADKQPVGKFDKRKSFTTHSIEYSDNSVFYLFTDGLPDQFGGPKGKKFMYKRFENNFSDISKLPMDEQQTILEKAFHDWKGTLEQVDDITVIGVCV